MDYIYTYECERNFVQGGRIHQSKYLILIPERNTIIFYGNEHEFTIDTLENHRDYESFLHCLEEWNNGWSLGRLLSIQIVNVLDRLMKGQLIW